MHDPRDLGRADGDTIILCVHGFLGGPDLFAPLLPALSQAYRVRTLLLPGHAAPAAHYRRTGKSQWQAYVTDELRRAQQAYAHVVLLGHSMGGLLSLNAHLTSPRPQDGLALWETPLRLHLTWRWIRNDLTLAFVPQHRWDEIAQAYSRENSIQVNHCWDYLTLASPTADLMRLIRAGRRSLGEVCCPALVIHAGKDEIVSPASQRILLEGIPLARGLELSESWHSMQTENDRNRMVLEMAEWIEKIIRKVG